MRILITGSNGLLGQKLITLLSSKKIDVVATGRGLDRSESGDEHYCYAEMDITDADQVGNVLHQFKPDVVINTAAMTNVDQCESEKEACRKLNVDAVANLISACRKANAFLVHLSTDFIFDGEAGPYSETHEANPISFYGQSKLDAEVIVKESDIDWAIVRTVLVYGIVPNMSRSNIILWVKDSLEKGKPIKVVTDQWRTPTLVEDLAMGCLLIAQQKATGIFNISGKEMLTPYDMAMMTAEYFDLDASTISKADSSTFSQPAKRPPKTGFVIEKAKNELGYKPHSFLEGIALLDSQMKKM